MGDIYESACDGCGLIRRVEWDDDRGTALCGPCQIREDADA